MPFGCQTREQRNCRIETESNRLLRGWTPGAFHNAIPPNLVRLRGLEPPRFAPHAPQACASANSAIAALLYTTAFQSRLSEFNFNRRFETLLRLFAVTRHKIWGEHDA